MSWIAAMSDRFRSAVIAGLTAAAMLVAAGVVLALYDSQVYKDQKLREITVQTQILAATVTAPLEFDDPDAAREYLTALQANPEIDAAAVYNEAGTRIAAIAHDANFPAPQTAPEPQAAFGGDFLTVALQVAPQGRAIGTVYVRAVTEPLFRRLARYGGIALLMIMASLMVAVLVTAHTALSRANVQLEARASQLAEANQKLVVEIKEREKAEDALRQAQKMEAVGQLTGGIAHDFNNMLAVIVGNLSLLLRRAAQGKDDLTKYAEGALEGASRGARLTQQLLAFSRQQPLTPVALDPNKLLSGMSELLRRALGEHIRFETVIAGGIWTIHADKTQLETAILNLAVNARDAMPDGGTLTIETSNAYIDHTFEGGQGAPTPGQYVVIAVTDTGTGMPPEVTAKAFDPFFTTKPVGQGTGLGLSQVYGFVRQSRGQVKIYSEVGHGTTVKLYLPRHIGDTQRESAPETSQNLPMGNVQEVIVVAEDDATVRRMTVDSLRDLGYTVHHAEGATSALRLLEMHPETTLLFTDIVMPDGNGRKLAEDARLMRPDLKVLFTTGYARDAIVNNGMLEPNMQLLTKPYTIAQLATKVRSALGPASTSR
jgi:signal transduction histidine kinase/ActR/RegA family two-component response regulator